MPVLWTDKYAPPTLTRGPRNLTILKPQQKDIRNKNTTQTQHRARPS